MAQALRDRLLQAYQSVRIGDPLDRNTVMGPVVHRGAIDALLHAKAEVEKQGGHILCGGEPLPKLGECYVTPCLAEASPDMAIVQEETFAPLLYLMTYRDFDKALEMHNAVPQGLSSGIFTNDFREAERFRHANAQCKMFFGGAPFFTERL